MKPTESEWSVLEILWSGTQFSLSEITQALEPVNHWNKNTVHTYLTRMKKKGMVSIDRTSQKPYSACITREDCAHSQRSELLHKVYKGRTGDLITAFLKESPISQKEVAQLRKLLDDMEV